MKWDGFPARIMALEPYSPGFDAVRLQASGCDVLFASYPAETRIEPHRHDTDNWGVVTKGAMTITCGGETCTYATGDWYHVPRDAEHHASCEVETQIIEFWFADAAGARSPVAA